MVKKEKYHFEPNEVKIDILDFVLKNDKPVSEPNIREYLNTKYGGIDQSNVNRHLHGLEGLGCIELHLPAEKSRSNFWGIKTPEHLKAIKAEKFEMQLNIYEKSLDIVLNTLGIVRKSSRYVDFFIRMRLSPSFFTMCMDTDIELLHSRARELFNHDKGFKNEQRLEELLKGYNSQYIKGQLNFEMSEERLRETMGEISLNVKDLYVEYICRTCHFPTEPDKENFRRTQERYENDIIGGIMADMMYNPGFCRIDQKSWVEIFHEKFTERIPELLDMRIETILKTPDEYKNIYLKTEEIFALIKSQNEMFERSYLDLLFEHFYYSDLLDGIASRCEKTFAQNTKKITEIYYADLESINNTEVREKREQFMSVVNGLVLGEMENISTVMARYKIPSILPDISDDPKEVLIKLLKLYNHYDILKQLEKQKEHPFH
jgi:hypothetical protein